MSACKLKARTALATEIALVNRQRFNEAVAEGFYPCAPSTVRGATRLFDVNDIVTLRIYGRLLDEGMIPRSAGQVACGLRTLLAQHPDAERVVHVTTSMGSPVWLRADEFDRDATDMSGTDIVSAREWYLKYTRGRVIRDLEEESNALGSDD
ncbi:hypothetical protein [Methylobacterium soli]|uniref:Uncharacterized protein n=1 Tax=Methylobacterium soli TaxID=553447 RepID=A0A6L3TCG3_9HYPH|nr:hypothetical protein [Methylobacterium soli]KAB1081723.1 hypothetical protein F6X53_01075 [Methylobacterium soli]GJE46187.1 hypothetical protein AEGHOMDF_5387 [Methylobacterium soli]